MSYIDAPRTTCALGGALDLVNSIHRQFPLFMPAQDAVWPYSPAI